MRRWRWRRVFLLHSFKLKLDTADYPGDYVVDQRADRSHDESEHAIKDRQTNHHGDAHDDRANAAGRRIAAWSKCRNRGAKDDQDQPIDHSEDQPKYEHEQPIHLRH